MARFSPAMEGTTSLASCRGRAGRSGGLWRLRRRRRGAGRHSQNDGGGGVFHCVLAATGNERRPSGRRRALSKMAATIDCEEKSKEGMRGCARTIGEEEVKNRWRGLIKLVGIGENSGGTAELRRRNSSAWWHVRGGF